MSGIVALIVRKVKVEIEIVPDGLPDSSPVGRGSLIAVSDASLLTACSSVICVVYSWRDRLALLIWSHALEGSRGLAAVAEPVGRWYRVQTNAIGVVVCIAVVACHEHIFIVVITAEWAWSVFVFVVELLDEY